ncbi:Lrp/AsnC family transcriptional regulator [Candidatus Peregrinibacteria bacterium]|nr:Lrp/AsnC family transcriptional regulator [Candidatus Peregrinibacteria bacterium]
MRELDKLDWNILALLDWQGRMPIQQIAKQVKSNKDVVGYRIKHLEKNEIIISDNFNWWPEN